MDKKKFFSDLYDNIDGSAISWESRNKLSDDEIKHLIYGEISFDSLNKIYNCLSSKISLNNLHSFCDLGSGTGRIVIATSLLLPHIQKYTGVEILDGLYDKSINVLKTMSKNNIELASKINFIKNDFFNVDLSEFDFVFMHYPMKHAEELYLKLEEKMKKELKNGSIIISAIRKLRNIDVFPCIKKQRFIADYGVTNIYYHIKNEKNY